jgi:hypothetical protein
MVLLAALIEKLSKRIESSALDTDQRNAAAVTGGVPVYSDMGGVLVLNRDLTVSRYDPDDGSIKQASAEWRMLALRRAQLFPELSSLAPQRLADAADCPSCHGIGSILGGMLCGTCVGSGWLAPE